MAITVLPGVWLITVILRRLDWPAIILLFFSIVSALVHGGRFELIAYFVDFRKSFAIFLIFAVVGHYIYSMLKLPCKQKQGKGFTFILVLGF